MPAHIVCVYEKWIYIQKKNNLYSYIYIYVSMYHVHIFTYTRMHIYTYTCIFRMRFLRHVDRARGESKQADSSCTLYTHSRVTSTYIHKGARSHTYICKRIHSTTHTYTLIYYLWHTREYTYIQIEGMNKTSEVVFSAPQLIRARYKLRVNIEDPN